MNENEYENAVAKYLVDMNPNYCVKYNHSIIGRFSKKKRQIDVYIENNKSNEKIVVECKYYNKKIDVKTLDSFIGFLDDVGITDGLLITNHGASKPSYNRVAQSNIRIRILGDENLKNYKLGGIIPYNEDRMAMIIEPIGYVTSLEVRGLRACCVFLPIGKSYQKSFEDGSFLYLDISQDVSGINDRLKSEEEFIEKYYNAKIHHQYVRESDLIIRKSFIPNRNRYDFGFFSIFKTGIVIIHGIIEKSDLAWTITSLKRMMHDAHFYVAPVSDKNEKGFTMTIEDIEIRK